MLRPVQNNPEFVFTSGQYVDLLRCLTRDKNNPEMEDTHENFLSDVTRCVGYWLWISNAKTEYLESTDRFRLTRFDVPPRKSEIASRAKAVTGAITNLRVTLQGLSPDIFSYLHHRVDDASRSEAFSNLRDTLSAHHKKSDMNLHPGAALLLRDILKLYHKGATDLLNQNKEDGGQHSPLFKPLVLLLAQRYEFWYEKKPGYSKGTKFFDLMKKIAEIFSQTISAHLIKGVFKDNDI